MEPKYQIGDRLLCILPEGEDPKYGRNEEKGGSGWKQGRVFTVRISYDFTKNSNPRCCYFPEEDHGHRFPNNHGVYEDWLNIADKLESIKNLNIVI